MVIPVTLSHLLCRRNESMPGIELIFNFSGDLFRRAFFIFTVTRSSIGGELSAVEVKETARETEIVTKIPVQR